MNGGQDVLEAIGLTATYRARTGEHVHALADVSAAFAPGRLTVIIGPSGSGKTTLLHCLAGIILATAGSARYGATRLETLREAGRDEWRRRNCGLVFQDFRLIDELDAIGNVLLPARFAQFRLPGALRERARRLLDGFGVPRRSAPAARLSRGERQRVALARALLLDPPIVLADEPTASLDRGNAEAIAAELQRLARSDGRIVICASHDERVAARADDTLALQAGRKSDPVGARELVAGAAR
ncbi:MAG TPA: ATP-binding cassette domain-containing protein [Beijerinckiaceae bacterium]|nr:ATP-binding cassette domain-containing protein [Beijerinckiaceae bacterium]